MEKKKIVLSVALAVMNEEQNLKACLLSVGDLADEIVVVDGGSTDKTVDVARERHAKVIITDNPPIFHINKQKALDACRGEWILQLDADEIITEELKNEIVSVLGLRSSSMIHELRTKNQEPINGYYIPRRNYFLGKWLRKGGQYPDYVIRLVRKGYASFPCKSVHEQIYIDGKLGYLTNPLFHYSYRTVEEYWKKADTYTTLTAQELIERKIKPGFSIKLLYSIFKPLKTFILLYFRHKGCMDGINGFKFALFSSLHHPIAYKKFQTVYTLKNLSV